VNFPKVIFSDRIAKKYFIRTFVGYAVIMSDNIQSGWYPDPDGKPSEKYWDGSSWTEQTRPLINKSVENTPLQSKNKTKLGCFGWTIIAVIALITFSCVTGNDGDTSSAPAIQESSDSEVKETQPPAMEYSSLVEWINGNNASSYFDELAMLSFEIGDAANSLDVERMTNLMDEMAFIGLQMKMIDPSPDSKFNEYWNSIYTDLIEIGTYTPAIRMLDVDAVEAATIAVQRMGATVVELNEYIVPLLLD